MRPKLIAGNWKMHGTLKETRKLLIPLCEKSSAFKRVEVAVCPPFTSLFIAKQQLGNSHIKLGAQNCYLGSEGAFTGEISTAMLVDIGCEYVILGHSERRQFFGESDELISKKIRAALVAGLKPIVCIGETEEQRANDQTESVLSRQISQSLNGMTTAEAEKLVIAYEPIWAIGTGKTATPDQAQDAHAFIRKELGKTFGSLAEDMRILYGGSVKPENADTLFREPDIDGGLVGGASLDAE
ncbi:MAG TPA: triose-phosphate isomerase, partial [Candidatus Kapabacteria bacterium]|nr:triose-phosphate isomerase [Candidatus Kapabacteria bacterium]